MSEKTFDLSGFRIVSGGQSGADQAALDWAIANGFDQGGWCPKGRKSEDEKIDLKYLLTETQNENHLERTGWNVSDSDATVIFTLDPKLSGGSKKTMEFAEKLGKPCRHFRQGVDPKFLRRFLEMYEVKVLNVAGPRASNAPGIAEFVRECMDKALLDA